jgi:hypothetical protein
MMIKSNPPRSAIMAFCFLIFGIKIVATLMRSVPGLSDRTMRE